MIIKIFEKPDPTENPLYREVEKLKMRVEELETKISTLMMRLALEKRTEQK